MKSAKNNTTKLSSESTSKTDKKDPVPFSEKDLEKMEKIASNLDDSLKTVEAIKATGTISYVNNSALSIGDSTYSGGLSIGDSSYDYITSTVGTSLTWSPPSGNYFTTTSPTWTTAGFACASSESTPSWISFLKEDELHSIFEHLLERSSDEKVIRDFVQEMLEEVHISEDFIIEVYKYTDKSTIMRLHASDINSGVYASLKLLMEV